MQDKQIVYPALFFNCSAIPVFWHMAEQLLFLPFFTLFIKFPLFFPGKCNMIDA